MDVAAAKQRIRSLKMWQGAVEIQPLGGGRTNLNFVVTDAAGRYVVRFGEDMPEHQLLRFNELAAARAAHAAGLSPAILHAEAGLSVIEFIDARTFDEPDVRDLATLERILPLLKKCHREVPKYLRGPALVFWVFHVIRDYAATLEKCGTPYHAVLPEFLKIAETLEHASGPFDIVFGHNDMMAANILDDGDRLWLIDWDYAGFNTPLFDLGGLASNNGLDEKTERHMLEFYFDAPLTDALFGRYIAMKCASLLRETMWSMVSEGMSDLDVDFAAYTAENLTRFRRAHSDYLNR